MSSQLLPLAALEHTEHTEHALLLRLIVGTRLEVMPPRDLERTVAELLCNQNARRTSMNVQAPYVVSLPCHLALSASSK